VKIVGSRRDRRGDPLRLNADPATLQRKIAVVNPI
jgi:hypothetical protein